MTLVEIRNEAAPAKVPGPGADWVSDPMLRPELFPGRQRDAPELGAMVGRSAAMQSLFARMQAIAAHFRLASIEGEPGVGKKLAAQTLHRLGRAAAGSFASWTAAEFVDRAPEIWSRLHGGLLYLARVDELTAHQQARLRDFLERAAQERIRTEDLSGPLQIVAGSAQPLRKASASGAFRTDLAGSLSAIRFAIPPLRERPEDIPLLAEVFLRRWSAEHGKPLRGFAPATMEQLTAHLWPDNVRELETAVEAAALTTSSQWIRPIDLPQLGWKAKAPLPITDNGGEDPNLERAILRHVARVLARVHGNKLRAARLLGISRSTLYRMLHSSATVDKDMFAACGALRPGSGRQ